jgi:hypothetical protein
MAANFSLKQHLKMSPNAKIKNLVPENLPDVPPEEEWKLGRIWFNIAIGKLQGVFLKLDTSTGLPIEPHVMEVRVVGADALGPTEDGQYWPDGLFDFTEQTKISDAMDDVNEALKDLAPPEPTLLRGDLEITQELRTGRISKGVGSSPDALRMTGIFEGIEIDYIINDSNVELSLPTDGLVVKGESQQQFGRADKGVITAIINDQPADEGIDLGLLYNEDARDYYDVAQGYAPPNYQPVVDESGVETRIEINPNKDNYKSESGVLIINNVARYNGFKKWQKGDGNVVYSATPGRHTIKVEHAGTFKSNDTVLSTNEMEVFVDPNTTAPTTVIKSFEVVSGNTKYVSGIPFYNDGVTFSLNFEASSVFSYTYWDKPISLSMEGTTLGLVEWKDSASNLNGKTIPNWDDKFELNSYIVEYSHPNTITDTITLVTKAGKPSTGWGPESSISRKLLFDTNAATGHSNPLKESFIDEEYRMQPLTVDMNSISSVENATTGTWNSDVVLQEGQAQQFMGSLMKAQSNYSEFLVNVDYTSLAAADQNYYRRFFTDSTKPNYNGILKVVTDGTIGIDFDIFVKLPEVTAWLDVKDTFDAVEFSEDYNTDGTACGVDLVKTNDGYELPWTVGTFSTANTGYGYVIKVVIKTSNFKIDEIEEISENWR